MPDINGNGLSMQKVDEEEMYRDRPTTLLRSLPCASVKDMSAASIPGISPNGTMVEDVSVLNKFQRICQMVDMNFDALHLDDLAPPQLPFYTWVYLELVQKTDSLDQSKFDASKARYKKTCIYIDPKHNKITRFISTATFARTRDRDQIELADSDGNKMRSQNKVFRNITDTVMPLKKGFFRYAPIYNRAGTLVHVVHDPYSSTNPRWTENCLLNGIFQETTYQFMQGVGVETEVHSDRCTACSPGKYKSSTDANVLCSDCPAGSTSVAQSTDITNCECMEGYFLQGTTCAPCEAGTNKSSTSNELCTQCPVTKTSVTNSIDVSNCKCEDGYGFGFEVGGQGCTICDAVTYNFFDPTQNTSTICRSCPLHSTSVAKSRTCTCADGYLMTNPQSASPQCQACPANSVCAVVSSGTMDCKCNAGFSGQSCGTCNPCIEGKFKSSNGTDACMDCHTGTYSSLLAATSCQLCPLKSYTSSQGATSCQLCPAGTYTSLEGATSCLLCPVVYNAHALTDASASGEVLKDCIDLVGT